jgi:ATP-dependent RNA helicase RhlE
VINFEMPNEPETYVHRIGRTGRALATGVALSFCDHEELKHVRDIERVTKVKIPVITDHPWAMDPKTSVPPGGTPVQTNSRPRGQHHRGRPGQAHKNGSRPQRPNPPRNRQP